MEYQVPYGLLRLEVFLAADMTIATIKGAGLAIEAGFFLSFL